MRLSESERATAELLGEGVLAEGVRVALQASSILGVAKVRAIIDGAASTESDPQRREDSFPRG